MDGWTRPRQRPGGSDPPGHYCGARVDFQSGRLLIFSMDPVAVRTPGTQCRPGHEELHGPVHPVRFVTAASLFDGHDAAINIIRRLLQAQGAEVVHLGHNRSVDEVVNAAIG